MRSKRRLLNILIESGSRQWATDDSADYLKMRPFASFILRLNRFETVKITAYYPESADIEAITTG